MSAERRRPFPSFDPSFVGVHQQGHVKRHWILRLTASQSFHSVQLLPDACNARGNSFGECEVDHFALNQMFLDFEVHTCRGEEFEQQ